METGIRHIVQKNRYHLLIIFLLSLIVQLPAFAHSSENSSEHNHEGLTWPPEPRGITNVIVHPDLEQQNRVSSLVSNRAARLERQAISHPKANSFLGKKFKRMTLIEKEEKQKGKVLSEVVFFSYDKNATVNIEFADDNIQRVKSTPAREYQPEIIDEEAMEAEALARTYFLNQGFTRIDNLKAFSILAYKPEGRGFFDSRVIYVSFHVNEDTPPEFMAWVDLTHQRIIKAREEP